MNCELRSNELGHSRTDGSSALERELSRPFGRTCPVAADSHSQFRNYNVLRRSREIPLQFPDVLPAKRAHRGSQLSARASRRIRPCSSPTPGEPVQGRVPRQGKRPYTRAPSSQKLHARQRKAQRPGHVGRRSAITVSSRCWATFSFGDYFRRRRFPSPGSCSRASGISPAERLYPTIFKGDAGIPRDGRGVRNLGGTVPPAARRARHRRELLVHGGHRAVRRRLLRNPLFPRSRHPVRLERYGGTCSGLECSCDRFVEIWNKVFREVRPAARRHLENRCRPRPSTPGWGSSA